MSAIKISGSLFSSKGFVSSESDDVDFFSIKNVNEKLFVYIGEKQILETNGRDYFLYKGCLYKNTGIFLREFKSCSGAIKIKWSLGARGILRNSVCEILFGEDIYIARNIISWPFWTSTKVEIVSNSRPRDFEFFVSFGAVLWKYFDYLRTE